MRLAARMLLAVALLAVALAVAQEEAPQPLTEQQLVEMLQAKTPNEQILAAVRERGIAFRLTPELTEQLKLLKAKSELLDLLTAPAALEIQANTPGGEVTLDGQVRGTLSPEGKLLLKDLPTGPHAIRVKAQEHVPANTSVFLKPGETRRLALELGTAVSATPGPLGTRVSVQAGTAEDSALAELEFEKDPAARAQRVQELIQRYGDSPLNLLLYGMLQDAYLSAEDYPNALAAGDELLRRDPSNFVARLRQARAYLGRGELEAAFDNAAQARQVVESLRQAPAPAGTSAESWASDQKQMLEGADAQLQDLSYGLLVAANGLQEPARKAALLERFVNVFPQSTYLRSAYLSLAYANQQRGDGEKMLAWANKGLELDPDQPVLIILVGTVLSERGQDLPRARQLATRLLELTRSQPEKIRPEGASDEQWTAQKQLWEGLAHSMLGKVLVYEETAQTPAAMAKTREAVNEFRAAQPLLQADPGSHAANLYWLGFAYAKLGELGPAASALNEVIALDTPYRGPARELLGKVQAKRGR